MYMCACMLNSKYRPGWHLMGRGRLIGTGRQREYPPPHGQT
jgi:hypothetical protein